MPIFHSEDLKVEDQNLTFLIFGSPGVGKTSLGYSAENSLLLNLDMGAHRVKPEHRAGNKINAKRERKSLSNTDTCRF